MRQFDQDSFNAGVAHGDSVLLRTRIRMARTQRHAFDRGVMAVIGWVLAAIGWVLALVK